MRKYFHCNYPQIPGYSAYFEYEGEWVKRQIEVFRGTILLLSGAQCSDIPLSQIEYTPDQEIQEEAFTALWEMYSAGPHGTRRRDHPLLNPPFFTPPADS